MNLEMLSKSETSSPAFIGVEWSQSIHQEIVKQRKPFKKLLESAGMATDVISAMTATLGFEGDTHNSIFPSARTLWLDAEREDVETEEINNFYIQRFKIYKSFLGDLQTSAEILEVLSKMAWQRSTGSDDNNNSRDKKWLNVIVQNINEDAWAIIIVGANHCSDSNGANLYKLLKDEGFEVFALTLM